jgi:hypothetical protein
MESIKVLAVLGKACTNASWREQFFQAPEATAQLLVGPLNEDEQIQVRDLGGLGQLPETFTNRDEFVAAVRSVMDAVKTTYACPQRPCPR